MSLGAVIDVPASVGSACRIVEPERLTPAGQLNGGPASKRPSRSDLIAGQVTRGNVRTILSFSPFRRLSFSRNRQPGTRRLDSDALA